MDRTRIHDIDEESEVREFALGHDTSSDALDGEEEVGDDDAPLPRQAIYDELDGGGPAEPTPEEVEAEALMAATKELAVIEARDKFWAFRQYINPDLLTGWWQCKVAEELQIFYNDLIAGKRPVLVLNAPPQHGKSTQVRDFIAWIAGKLPDVKSLYASYSDDLGVESNIYLQRIFDGEKFRNVFGQRIAATNNVSISSRYQRNRYMLEYVAAKGSFRNTTVQGAINGVGLGLGVVDDPLKGRVEAQSKAIRDKTWQWFTDDFFGRFTKDAGFILMATRWHVDDPVGRWLERFPNTRILSYPAIAEVDEKHRKKGQALFPAHKPLEFLLDRKKLLSQPSWASVYQQSPIVAGGELFMIEKFSLVDAIPNKRQIKRSVRYWDKAGTAGGGAYTCGVLMHELVSGEVLVADVVRGQWSALQREERMKLTSNLDRDMLGSGVYTIWIEQEPGSGGKESAERTITNLRGFSVHADKVTTSKEIRAEPYSAQVEAGNVQLLRADWNESFIDEHETFPGGKYRDQVDAAAGAFMKVTQKGNYDTSLSWVNG